MCPLSCAPPKKIIFNYVPQKKIFGLLKNEFLCGGHKKIEYGNLFKYNIIKFFFKNN